MRTADAPLPSRLIPPRTTFCDPSDVRHERTRVEEPAIMVMTDLRRIEAATIHATDTVSEAQRRMSERRVHSLFVVEGERDIAGLVTSTDLQGEKPMQVIAQRGCGWRDVLVSDIMTSRNRLEALDMKDVAAASVGRIIATLKASGRQHAMAIEYDQRGRARIRGLFSARQIERQVGTPILTTEIAQNFSEIVALLV